MQRYEDSDLKQDSGLRLCETVTAAGRHGDRAVSAVWDPCHSGVIGAWYSSNVFRLWDVVHHEYREFVVLSAPQGIPVPTEKQRVRTLAPFLQGHLHRSRINVVIRSCLQQTTSE